MNRKDLVLAVLAAADGQPYTPVQIQKALFLASQNLPQVITEGPAFAFTPYDYGPFDSGVYAEAAKLSEEELAAVSPSPSGRWKIYAATPAGVARGHELLNALPADQRQYLEQVSAWVRRLGFAALVKSIYEAYPAMRANSIFQG